MHSIIYDYENAFMFAKVKRIAIISAKIFLLA